VTGSPASSFSNHSDSDYEPDSLQSSIIYPLTPPLEISGSFSSSRCGVAPQLIPTRSRSFEGNTPQLTPDDGIDDCTDDALDNRHSSDALDYLLTIFPQDGLKALPFSRSVSISAPELGASFDGVVLELPGTPKTLYVDGKSAESVSLRESIVALLDLADERLQCTALVIALERNSPSLGELLHSLMYVGATVVTKPPFQVNPAYVLVGLDV